MHIRCLSLPAPNPYSTARVNRFTAVSSTFTFQHLVDVLRAKCPERKNLIPEGEPGQNYKTLSRYDNSKAREILGIDFVPFEKCVDDTVDALNAMKLG